MFDNETPKDVECVTPPVEGTTSGTSAGGSPSRKNKQRFRVTLQQFATGGKEMVYEVAVDRTAGVAEIKRLRAKGDPLTVPLSQWLQLALDKWGVVAG